MKRMLLILTFVALPGAVYAQATDTGTTTLNVTVGSEASISITNSSVTMNQSGTEFAAFTGTTNFSYRIRTSQGAGSGSITALVTTPFSGSGAPATSDLTYTCSGSGSGTACSGSQTASESSAMPVRTFGADAHSANGGDSASVSWSLDNKTTFKTGDYQTIITFTISAS
jgi:hypothetical protein